MKIKTFLTILFCSLVISCSGSDPGEEYVTVMSIYQIESFVKINEHEWHKNGAQKWGYNNTYFITNAEDAQKIAAYVNQ